MEVGRGKGGRATPEGWIVDVEPYLQRGTHKISSLLCCSLLSFRSGLFGVASKVSCRMVFGKARGAHDRPCPCHTKIMGTEKRNIN